MRKNTIIKTALFLITIAMVGTSFAGDGVMTISPNHKVHQCEQNWPLTTISLESDQNTGFRQFSHRSMHNNGGMMYNGNGFFNQNQSHNSDIDIKGR